MEEMEKGTVCWTYTDRINRIRRAHTDKHSASGQNWGGGWLQMKTWFCKAYQLGTCTHTKDHELMSKLQKHICAFCVTQGKVSHHPEKYCHLSKNEQLAAQ